MPPIVADTTPLNYLVLIEAVEVLPRLYGRVLLPPSVLAEPSDPYAPVQVRAWVAQSRDWLRVVPLRAPADSSLMHLDDGERDGAAAARGRNLQVIGTLGVLDAAAARGWIDLPDVFSRLRQTTFRLPQRLMTTMLEQDARRKKGSKDK